MRVDTFQFQLLDPQLLSEDGEIPHHGLFINDWPVRASEVIIVENNPRYTLIQFRGTIWYSPLNRITIDELIAFNSEEITIRANS